MTDSEFIERSREVLWLIDFKQDKIVRKLEDSVINLLKTVYAKD